MKVRTHREKEEVGAGWYGMEFETLWVREEAIESGDF